jgi:hypothetical protein
MRDFVDEGGTRWVASATERVGDDYKGRFCFILVPENGSETDAVTLTDICWNSRETAERTLQTMGGSELRRRLRSALGRGAYR